MTTRKNLLTVLAVAIAMFAAANTAKADASTCVDSGTVDCFTLSYQNGALPGTGPWGYVQLTQVDANTVTIEFTAATGFIFHNAGVGFNTDLDPANLGFSYSFTGFGGLGSLSLDTAGTNFDGFGSGAHDFDVSYGGGNGSTSGFTDIIITITGTGISITNFEFASGTGDNNMFVAQVAPSNGSGCTGFAANGGPNGTTLPSGDCGGSQVPEPGSLMLFGTGLLGMAGFVRRKLMS